MKLFIQHDQMDCGPACLAMVASYFGKEYSLKFLRDNSFLTRDGVSLLGITQAAKKIGFETSAAKLKIPKLIENSNLFPCVLYWNLNHFVVLRKVSKNFFSNKYYFHIADPAYGLVKLNQEKFQKAWFAEDDNGIAMFLRPTEIFFNNELNKEDNLPGKLLFSYLYPYKKQIGFMFLLLLLGSGITVFFPFLTQALIDRGINAKSLHIVTIILISQLALYLGSLSIEILRNWLMLGLGTKISISIISEFLRKVLLLPIKFFETKIIGDFNQRIQDNERIEAFLTSQSLLTLFSTITFIVFFGVLWHYNFKILLVYLFLTIISISWSVFWFKKRRVLDYNRFRKRAENQEAIYEMLTGVTEMKLNQFEDFKRKEWENIVQKLYKINIRILRINQFQLSGFEFLNQIKNIFVTFLAAAFVIDDKMTLGQLLSVSYIIGQMNAPINQLITFFRSYQDAKLSLERLNDMQNQLPEENENNLPISNNISITREKITNGIVLNNISFQYQGPESPFVLNNVQLTIPNGKITAIVGASGSGKTTLLKLLLKFYEPTDGSIFYDCTNLNNISPKSLRKNCGVVMQDGYIFSDTIERNIATGDLQINNEKLEYATKIANLEEYINGLPLKFKTKIGASGNEISGGQKQRILIARAVYKNPHYIFFDEATSSLDAENEKVIHENLQAFFNNKTVVIVAHRLSTVKNADQIIVLKNGETVECGQHQELINNKKHYYNLIKNQLELGR